MSDAVNTVHHTISRLPEPQRLVALSELAEAVNNLVIALDHLEYYPNDPSLQTARQVAVAVLDKHYLLTDFMPNEQQEAQCE